MNRVHDNELLVRILNQVLFLPSTPRSWLMRIIIYLFEVIFATAKMQNVQSFVGFELN